jgi:hypothetical protein
VVVPSPSSRRSGFSGDHLHRLGGFHSSVLSSRCHVFYGHRRRDLASFGLSTCRQEDKCISLRLLYEGTSTSAEYSPSTTLALGNVASAAGASGSA